MQRDDGAQPGAAHRGGSLNWSGVVRAVQRETNVRRAKRFFVQNPDQIVVRHTKFAAQQASDRARWALLLMQDAGPDHRVVIDAESKRQIAGVLQRERSETQVQIGHVIVRLEVASLPAFVRFPCEFVEVGLQRESGGPAARTVREMGKRRAGAVLSDFENVYRKEVEQ